MAQLKTFILLSVNNVKYPTLATTAFTYVLT